jgi:cytochrome P450
LLFLENPRMLSLVSLDHTRLHLLAAKGFTNRFVQSLEPRINVTLRVCPRSYGGDSKYDVVDQSAEPFTNTVIVELMDLAVEDLERSHQLLSQLSGVASLADNQKTVAGIKANDDLQE